MFFSGGKNSYVMIFVMDNFGYHVAVLQAKLAIPVFPFLSLKYIYNTRHYDTLLNYHNGVYFGSLVRTFCESFSFFMIYCSRLGIKASN